MKEKTNTIRGVKAWSGYFKENSKIWLQVGILIRKKYSKKWLEEDVKTAFPFLTDNLHFSNILFYNLFLTFNNLNGFCQSCT